MVFLIAINVFAMPRGVYSYRRCAPTPGYQDFVPHPRRMDPLEAIARKLASSRESYELNPPGLDISAAVFSKPSDRGFANAVITVAAAEGAGPRELHQLFFMKQMKRMRKDHAAAHDQSLTRQARKSAQQRVRSMIAEGSGEQFVVEVENHEQRRYSTRAGFNRLTVQPGAPIKIHISCHIKHIGIARDVLILQFDDNVSTCRYLDVHFAGDLEQQESAASLAPTAQYNRPRRVRREQRLHVCEEVVAAPRQERTRTRRRRNERRKGERLSASYAPPTWKLKDDDSDSHAAIEVHDGTSLHGYGERFQHLLWAEELELKRNMERYRLDGVLLRKTAKRIIVHVNGLEEKRPSLIVGDSVMIGRCGEKRTAFKARIVDMKQCELYLDVDKRLMREYEASARYVIEFSIHRLPLMYAHRGVRMAAELHRGESLLFPTRAALHPARLLGDRCFERHTSFENELLNEAQRAAVESIVAGRSRDVPYLIFGPPGTGKTVTLVESVKQLVLLDSTTHILVCAPTNYAADLLCERLHELPLLASSPTSMVRMMARSRSLDSSVTEQVLAHTNVNLSQRSFEENTPEELAAACVIVATLGTASKLAQFGITADHFDAVLIDEAGQATEPETLAAFAPVIGTRTQLVLAGDPMQLGPVIQSSFAEQHGLGISLLERLFARDVYRVPHAGAAPAATMMSLVEDCEFEPLAMAMLTLNYRSHPEILRVPNARFYGHRLEACGSPSVTHALTGWDQLPNPDVPFIFHAVRGENQREESSPSWFNADEAVVCVQYVRELLRSGLVAESDIGVIAPYRKQVAKIRAALKRCGIDALREGGLRVGSTEQFQGSERKVIVLSTVRSEASFLSHDKAHSLGFVANSKRFNVAITRAQALLIVVGNPDVLAQNSDWRALLRHAQNSNAWRGDEWESDSSEEEMGEDHRDGDDKMSAQERRCAADAEALLRGSSALADEDTDDIAEGLLAYFANALGFFL